MFKLFSVRAVTFVLTFIVISTYCIQINSSEREREGRSVCIYVYKCVRVCARNWGGWECLCWGIGGVVWQTTCPYTWINLSSNETLWAGSEGCLQAPDYAAICKICLWLLLCHISYSQNPICFISLPFP